MTQGDSVAGRICLITGGGTGIGRAAALRFAAEGARAVVIGCRRTGGGELAAADVSAMGAHRFRAGDA